MAAPLPPHHVAPIQPNSGRDDISFGGLLPGVKNWLVRHFIQTWAFVTPPNSTVASLRQYAQGTWLPTPQSHSMIPLASGNSGMVHVWVCVDRNNNILDRVVVKQNVPGIANYNNPDNWAQGQIGGEPMESLIANMIHMQLLTVNPGAGDEKFVAECLGWGDCQYQPPELPQYKLYYEYLLGDLPGCIESQWRTSKLIKRPGRKRRTRVELEQEPFPEGFLWALFEALAKNAVAMDTLGIVHGDMQSANIFFDQPDPNHFAIWPVPKLGDFGSSRWAIQIQGQLGRHHIGPYAETFAAPEMDFDDSWWPGQHVVQFFDHWDPNLPPTAPGGRPGGYVQRPAVLSSKTNIWQIGMIVLSAIRLEPHLLETQWRSPPPNYPVPMHQAMGFRPGFASQPMKMRLDDPKSRRYSRQLLTLVKKCLVFDPDARISPQQLLQEVQAMMVGRDDGMMTARGRFPHNHPLKLRMSLTDKYKVGKKPYKPRKVA